MSEDIVIRNVQNKDVAAITELYNHYISETVITFETETITPEIISTRIENVQSEGLPWLTAEDDSGEVIGYAYACKWRERIAYRFTVEITVYLSPHAFGKGVGTRLYKALFSELKQLKIHSVIGGITLPNQRSVDLHEKFGMKKVAHYKEVGYKFDQWLDVGFWQGMLNT